MKIFFILQTPLTIHDANRVETELFVEAGLDFEFIDATGILFPTLKISDQPWASLPSTHVDSLDELEAICNRITNQDVIIFFGGIYPGQIEKTDSVYRSLAKTSGQLGAINVVHIPLHTQPNAPLPTKLYLLLRRGPVAWWTVLSKRFLRQVTQLKVKRQTLRSLDFVWAGTMLAPISNRIIDVNTKIRYIHTYDYEDAKKYLSSQNDARDYVVFLDSMGPDHPDYGVIEKNPYKINTVEYHDGVRSALAKIADDSSLEIIVAAHPRAITGTLDSLFQPFKVQYGMTPELVSRAKIVLDASSSTAASFAVVNRVPIVYLSSLQFGPYINLSQKTLAKLLNTFSVPLQNVGEVEWKNIDVDEASYIDYETTFIKRPGSLMEPFWHQVIRDLLKIVSTH